jgi:hypothetical protein
MRSFSEFNPTSSMKTTPFSTQLKSRYHRYCGGCGWGFTKHTWLESAFCTRCGQQLAKAPHGVVYRNDRVARKDRKPAKSYSGQGEDGVDLIEPSAKCKTTRRGSRSAALAADLWKLEASASQGGRLSGKVSECVRLVQQHPYAAAAVGATLGAACIAGGPALAAVGIQIVGLGAGITTASVILGLLAAAGALIPGAAGQVRPRSGARRPWEHILRSDPSAATGGLVVAVAGAIIGTAVGFVGGLISALGAAIAVGGTVLISISALIALTRTSQLAWEHREQIRHVLRQVRSRLPGATQIQLDVLPSGSPAQEGVSAIYINMPRRTSKVRRSKAQNRSSTPHIITQTP